MREVERGVAKIADLHDAPWNPRAIPPENLAALRESMRRWGVVQEVVVNRRTGTVVGGHQRLKVLREEGAAEVPVAWVDLDETDERALNISLNSRTLEGEWTPNLSGLLDEIGAALPDLSKALRFDELRADVGVFDVAPADGAPALKDGDRSPIQQMTFTVHDTQADTVREALTSARSAGGGVSDVNENGNGNALAYVCAAYLLRG